MNGTSPPDPDRFAADSSVDEGNQCAHDVARSTIRATLRGKCRAHRGLLRETPIDCGVVAVNTAIEIDPFGQVNVEGRGEKVVGGIGGHPDYCAAARMSHGGLSTIAVRSTVNGHSPLVDQLSRPVSTPAHDVDLIVTESGHADLRGADWSQRRRLITTLFQ